jgi:ADP-ribose pyrophosphatase
MVSTPGTDAAGREILGEGKFLRLVRDGRWEIAERTTARGAVAIVAVTADGRLVLTEQYRPAVKRQVIDLAAGLAGDEPEHAEEAFAETARRELLEETGYAAERLEHLADCPSSPGLTSEIVSYFLARSVIRHHAGGGVGHEQIQVHTPCLASLQDWLAQQTRAGKLIDVKVYAALYFIGQTAASPCPTPIHTGE